MIYFYFY